jgi:8-oxo-dGTP pyrophosphatase MutT (NUDIX family)
MELNQEEITTPPRDAASVVLLRDTDEGLQVFLLRRASASAVLGGAYVFPGGKVDDSDALPDTLRKLTRTPDHLLPTLNQAELAAERAAGLYVAALREAFEESGVLLAQWERRTPTLTELAHAAKRLNSGTALLDLLIELGAQLDADAIVPWSRWITPKRASVMTKRFDTRFFVAGLPAGQHAQHDDHETDESVWLSPHRALEQYYASQIDLAPPQIMSLAHLARHDTVASVLTEARTRLPPLVEPQTIEATSDTRVICYPGDPAHTVHERALPGPTRLHFVGKRFMAPDGPADWWRHF